MRLIKTELATIALILRARFYLRQSQKRVGELSLTPIQDSFGRIAAKVSLVAPASALMIVGALLIDLSLLSIRFF